MQKNLKVNCRLHCVDQVYIKEDGTLRHILGQHVCTAPAFVVCFGVYRLYIFPECLAMPYFIHCTFQRSVCAYFDCSWFCFVTLRTCGTFTCGLLIEQAVCRKTSCGVGHVAVWNSWTATARLSWLAYTNGNALWLYRYWLHTPKKQDLVAPTLRYINFSLRLVRLICMACINSVPTSKKAIAQSA